MESTRRNFVKGAGVAAAALACTSVLSGTALAEGAAATEEAVDPLTVTLSPETPLTEVEDEVAYNKERGSEDPDYGARITHVFGANSIMDYYLFDGFTGIGVYERNESIKLRDLVMEPAGGEMSAIELKDGGTGDLDSLVRDVKYATYTTADGTAVQLKCQSLHGAQLVADNMVVFTDNKPAKLNKSLTLPLDLFDGELPRGINYLLGNPDSGKHNTSGDDDGFSDTTIKFWFNENDSIAEGPQHIYTKYAYNGAKNYWLYIESEYTVDVRCTTLGTGDPAASDYVPGTSLSLSVVDGAGDIAATADATTPGRLGFSVPVNDTFFLDPGDPAVVRNADLSNQREFQFWKAEVGAVNTALKGDVTISCDLDCPGGLYFSISCDEVVAGDVELLVSTSAGRGTGWATEWSQTPATITVHVA